MKGDKRIECIFGSLAGREVIINPARKYPIVLELSAGKGHVRRVYGYTIRKGPNGFNYLLVQVQWVDSLTHESRKQLEIYKEGLSTKGKPLFFHDSTIIDIHLKLIMDEHTHESFLPMCE